MTTATIEAPILQTVPAIARVTLADFLRQLGDMPPDRVRADSMTRATLTDLIAANEHGNGIVCEWIDNTLVEKPVGAYESWLAIIIAGELYAYLKTHDLGMLYGEAAVLRILPDVGRAPDVAFVAWSSLPDGKPRPRQDRVPAVVPDLVIEVLSASNTPAEMARKRDEYFRAGVKRVWEISPESRSANVFSGPTAVTPVPADGTLDGDAVLPGFTLALRDLFDRADRR
ncbi:Uma2 family endonuclease [Gemmata sp. JC673]|uniref:Uma2 family endonuclease n=1 Tax=Gemmata algarum TaxID=2975278 RepID=A0ABU5F917_9BACT|nr:Uma2 family endonuclease [Gemmata algarum]MDY3563235.1 Uma2 family endonuclease [Gemmata algarum]